MIDHIEKARKLMANSDISDTEYIYYRRIEALEAMALIDQRKIKNLCFVERYYESKFAYGNGHYLNPSDIRETEPIRYGMPIIIETGKLFPRFKEIDAKPGEIIRETPCRVSNGHYWLLKEKV